MEKKNGKLEALPFIVPGARFNEKYGWDSVSSDRLRSPTSFAFAYRTVLHGARSFSGRQDGSRQEHCGALHFRDQALQQGSQR